MLADFLTSCSAKAISPSVVPSLYEQPLRLHIHSQSVASFPGEIIRTPVQPLLLHDFGCNLRSLGVDGFSRLSPWPIDGCQKHIDFSFSLLARSSHLQHRDAYRPCVGEIRSDKTGTKGAMHRLCESTVKHRAGNQACIPVLSVNFVSLRLFESSQIIRNKKNRLWAGYICHDY